MNRSEVLANRQKWIDFLLLPSTKKTEGCLEKPNTEKRCCLGHGCHVFNIPKKNITDEGKTCVLYEDNMYLAPESFINLVGLHNKYGSGKDQNKLLKGLSSCSLAELNDYGQEINNARIEYTPQMIGKYLQSVIEGGENTPFRPLSEYPEE